MFYALLFLPAALGIGFVLDAVMGEDDDAPAEPEVEVDPGPEPTMPDVEEGVPYVGDETDETILGTAIADTVSGGAGNDTILGEAGDDTLNGQAGQDTIRGGAGIDTINGGGADDFIFADEGNDIVAGGYGNDTVELGAGDDQYGVGESHLDNGDDEIHGGEGNDIISDRFGANSIFGGAGDDQLATLDLPSDLHEGFITPDTIDAGDGDDIVLADNGDTVTLGAGEDRLGVLRHDLYEGAGAVVVTDFNVAEDILAIEWEGTARDETLLELTEDNNGVMISYDGEALAFLEGLTIAEVNGVIDLTFGYTATEL